MKKAVNRGKFSVLPRLSNSQMLEEKAGRKFRAWETAIIKEDHMQFLVPLESTKRRRMAALFKKRYENSCNRIVGMLAELGNFEDMNEIQKEGAYEEAKNKTFAEWTKSMVAYETRRDLKTAHEQAEQEYLHNFIKWLCGKGLDEDHEKTPWRRDTPALTHPEVQTYINQFLDVIYDAYLRVRILIFLGPHASGINGYWLWYKYIINIDDWPEDDPFYFIDAPDFFWTERLEVPEHIQKALKTDFAGPSFVSKLGDDDLEKAAEHKKKDDEKKREGISTKQTFRIDFDASEVFKHVGVRAELTRKIDAARRAEMKVLSSDKLDPKLSNYKLNAKDTRKDLEEFLSGVYKDLYDENLKEIDFRQLKEFFRVQSTILIGRMAYIKNNRKKTKPTKEPPDTEKKKDMINKEKFKAKTRVLFEDVVNNYFKKGRISAENAAILVDEAMLGITEDNLDDRLESLLSKSKSMHKKLEKSGDLKKKLDKRLPEKLKTNAYLKDQIMRHPQKGQIINELKYANTEKQFDAIFENYNLEKEKPGRFAAYSPMRVFTGKKTNFVLEAEKQIEKLVGGSAEIADKMLKGKKFETSEQFIEFQNDVLREITKAKADGGIKTDETTMDDAMEKATKVINTLYKKRDARRLLIRLQNFIRNPFGAALSGPKDTLAARFFLGPAAVAHFNTRIAETLKSGNYNEVDILSEFIRAEKAFEGDLPREYINELEQMELNKKNLEELFNKKAEEAEKKIAFKEKRKEAKKAYADLLVKTSVDLEFDEKIKRINDDLEKEGLDEKEKDKLLELKERTIQNQKEYEAKKKKEEEEEEVRKIQKEKEEKEMEEKERIKKEKEESERKKIEDEKKRIADDIEASKKKTFDRLVDSKSTHLVKKNTGFFGHAEIMKIQEEIGDLENTEEEKKHIFDEVLNSVARYMRTTIKETQDYVYKVYKKDGFYKPDEVKDALAYYSIATRSISNFEKILEALLPRVPEDLGAALTKEIENLGEKKAESEYEMKNILNKFTSERNNALSNEEKMILRTGIANFELIENRAPKYKSDLIVKEIAEIAEKAKLYTPSEYNDQDETKLEFDQYIKKKNKWNPTKVQLSNMKNYKEREIKEDSDEIYDLRLVLNPEYHDEKKSFRKFYEDWSTIISYAVRDLNNKIDEFAKVQLSFGLGMDVGAFIDKDKFLKGRRITKEDYNRAVERLVGLHSKKNEGIFKKNFREADKFKMGEWLAVGNAVNYKVLKREKK